ncbi:ribonuclease J [Candidatus Falkowbacteria bacterium]|nr:ribonuclease J [Candidatus Falkowbacteria bacterium]
MNPKTKSSHGRSGGAKRSGRPQSGSRRFGRPHQGHHHATGAPAKHKFGLASRALVSAHKNSMDKLRIIVLGGMEEVGRNCTVFEYGNDIFIVDMGLQFPEEDMPGIDYIVNDFTYLQDKVNKVRGVVITHGHYDHIGGIPHLMAKVGNPALYTGVLTAGIIKKRQEEYRSAPPLNIQTINASSVLKFGSAFTVEFFRVNHNIPDCYGLVVKTPVGTIVHTGDFKFDKQPVNEEPMDINRLRQIAKDGVLVLMADSTNAEKPGHQLSETQVGMELEEIFRQVKGRMIVGTFASNLSRVQLLISLAEQYGRKVMVKGRSMVTNMEVASNLGFMKFKKNTMVDWQEAKSLPDDKLIIICTGAQGERNAVLMRMANNDHRYLELKKNDTVIFSSSVIPGNERTVQSLMDGIYRHDAQVIHYHMMDIHAGGHAKQGDLIEFCQIMKPKYYMPIEGNHFMLRINGRSVGEACGFAPDHVLIADNGQIIEVGKDKARVTEDRVPAEYIFVDGLGVGDISEVVLRDRRMMAEDGMLVVIVTIRKKTGELVQNPDLISRGFIYMKESKTLVEDTRRKVKLMLKDKDPASPAFENYLKNKIRNELGEFLWKQTKRRPMILPVLIEV